MNLPKYSIFVIFIPDRFNKYILPHIFNIRELIKKIGLIALFI